VTLPELLAGDLRAWMDTAADGVPRCVLLWLDPQSEFAGLIPDVEAALGALGARLLRIEDRRRQHVGSKCLQTSGDDGVKIELGAEL